VAHGFFFACGFFACGFFACGLLVLLKYI